MTRTGSAWSGMLMALLLGVHLCAGRAFSHPFDGDGNGPAKEGSSNVQGYLYIEPFTCRVECLIWLPTALELFALPPGSDLILSENAKSQLIEKARAEGPSWCVVKVNGVEQGLDLTAATVLRGRPGATDALTPGDTVGVMDSMLGLTWECSAPADIQQAELEWRKFRAAVPGIPITIVYGPVFENGIVLSPAEPKGLWKNNGNLPPARALSEVPPLPPKPTVRVPLGSIAWGLVVIIIMLGKGLTPRRSSRRFSLAVLALFLGGMGLWRVGSLPVRAPWVARQTLTPAQAQEVLQALLRNTYRAFEQRDESAIYDVLARSIHGDLLQRIYLQTARALALEAQDGTKVKVSDLAVDVDAVTQVSGGEGFVASGQWTAFGRVGHWGHMHQRINKYKANMTVSPVEGAWKLTNLEVLEETRDLTKPPGQ